MWAEILQRTKTITLAKIVIAEEFVLFFLEKVDEVFESVSALLKDDRKYLCNTPDMSAADITFASLAYPLILPKEKAKVFVSWDDDLPEEFRTEVKKRRETPAGQFVLRLYKEERHL